MFQIGHWHGNTQLDRWWMLCLDSIWLIFWCRKTAYTLFIWSNVCPHMHMHTHHAQMNYGRNSCSSAPPPLISPLPWHLAVTNSLTWAWLQTINQDFERLAHCKKVICVIDKRVKWISKPECKVLHFSMAFSLPGGSLKGWPCVHHHIAFYFHGCLAVSCRSANDSLRFNLCVLL